MFPLFFAILHIYILSESLIICLLSYNYFTVYYHIPSNSPSCRIPNFSPPLPSYGENFCYFQWLLIRHHFPLETITALFKTRFRVDFPFDVQEFVAFGFIGYCFIVPLYMLCIYVYMLYIISLIVQSATSMGQCLSTFFKCLLIRFRLTCGLAGALFVYAHRKIVDFHQLHKHNRINRFLEKRYYLLTNDIFTK